MLNIVVCLYPNCQRTHGAFAPSTKLKAKNWKLSGVRNFQLRAFNSERSTGRDKSRLRREYLKSGALSLLILEHDRNQHCWSWWRWTGSNRWPPACKAGALPTELHPQYNWRFNIAYWKFRLYLSKLIFNLQLSIINSTWWAWMELNHRPHAYQACALTKLSYRPPAISDLRLQVEILNSLNIQILKSKIRLSLSFILKNTIWSLKTK